MEKLKKLRLDRTESIMTENEMKHVIGGARESNHCYYGELLYTCYTTVYNYDGYGNDFQPSAGSACASSAGKAADKVFEALKSQGLGGRFSVSCA